MTSIDLNIVRNVGVNIVSSSQMFHLSFFSKKTAPSIPETLGSNDFLKTDQEKVKKIRKQTKIVIL